MHLNVPTTADLHVSTGRTNCMFLHLILIYILPSTAYRRKTTVSLDLTKPVRTTKKARKPRGPNKRSKLGNLKKSSDELDYSGDADADADADEDDANADEDMDADVDDYDKVDKNTDDDTGWFQDLKMDPQFAEDENMLWTTGTPIDLRTNYKPRWTRFTDEDEFAEETTEITSTTLMDLSVIEFNQTWCTYVEKPEAHKLESEAFIEAVKKLCSEDYADDNDVRLALRHTIESRKLIDRLVDNICNRISGKDIEKKKKLLNPKHKVNTQNEFCYSRALKSFKYLCFDAEANPYMERYLKVLSNACRLPGVDVSDIREHLVEACQNFDNNLVDVL